MYKVKIYENDICITVGTISKEQGIQIQEIAKVQNNIYLDRLRQQYKLTKTDILGLKTHDYKAMRLFCLDTQLISFNDIEVMELEINSSF